MTGHRVGERLARSAAALAVMLAAGCVSLPTVQDPAQDPALGTGLTATRAGYVALMLENIVRTTSHDRGGQVFAIAAAAALRAACPCTDGLHPARISALDKQR